MKIYLYIIIFTVVVQASCQRDKQAIIKDFANGINRYDTSLINEVVDKNVVFNKSYLATSNQINLDSLKYVGINLKVLKTNIVDEKIETTELVTSKFDSLIGNNYKLTTHNTYKVRNSIIVSLETNYVDSLSYYNLESKKRRKLFNAYLNIEYPDISKTDLKIKLLSIAESFNHLSENKKKEYLVKNSLINNMFFSKSAFPPMGLMFKSKSIVYISTFGFKIGTTYIVDGEDIQIQPVQGSLPMPLVYKDENTMIGQSLYGECIFKRVNKH